MDIIQMLNWRYATKKFNPNKILTNEQLTTLKEAFNLTATSYGLQTIKLVVIKHKTIREKLVPHAYGQKQVLDASHLLVICVQDNIVKNDIIAYYNHIKAVRNTPHEILKPYQDSLITLMENKTVNERVLWSKNQAYIALGNLLTVCAAIGIDACPMEGFVPHEFDTLLNLTEKNLKSVLLLPVGHRADDDVFSTFKKVRKPISDVIIEL